MSTVVKLLENLFNRGLESVGLYYSSYRAFVWDNEDPDRCNRIQFKMPALFGNEVPDMWAIPKHNFSGKNYGIQVLPQKGDVIFIEFEQGNIRKPLWIHGHFAFNEKPRSLSDVNAYWFQSPKGQLVFIDDTNELIRIKDKTGNIYEANKNGISLIRATDKHLSLGTLNASTEPAVLGNKNEDSLKRIHAILSDIQDMVSKFTAKEVAVTLAGPLAPLNPGLVDLQINNAMILEKLTQLNEQIPTTKSEKTSLD